MFPIILYEKTETTFDSEGLGRLNDALTCEVTEVRNGDFTLVMTYANNGVLAKELIVDRIVFTYPNKNAAHGDAFRIYYVKKTGDNKIEVYGRQIAQFRSMNVVVNPCSCRNKTAAQILSTVASNFANPADTGAFSFSSDITKKVGISITVPTLLSDVLQRLADALGGELEYNLMSISLKAHRGENRGEIARYSKNVSQIEFTEDGTNIPTSVISYFSNEDGRVVSVLAEPATIPTAHPHTKIMDVTSNFKNVGSSDSVWIPAQKQIDLTAQAEMMQNCYNEIPQSCAVQVVDTGEAQISLCDTLLVQYAPFGLSTEALVVKIVYDVLFGIWQEIEVGKLQPTLSQNILGTDAVVGEAAFNAKDNFIYQRFEDGVAHIFGTVPFKTNGAVTASGKWWYSERYSAELPLVLGSAVVSATVDGGFMLINTSATTGRVAFRLASFRDFSADTDFTVSFNIWGMEA